MTVPGGWLSSPTMRYKSDSVSKLQLPEDITFSPGEEVEIGVPGAGQLLLVRYHSVHVPKKGSIAETKPRSKRTVVARFPVANKAAKVKIPVLASPDKTTQNWEIRWQVCFIPAGETKPTDEEFIHVRPGFGPDLHDEAMHRILSQAAKSCVGGSRPHERLSIEPTLRAKYFVRDDSPLFAWGLFLLPMLPLGIFAVLGLAEYLVVDEQLRWALSGGATAVGFAAMAALFHLFIKRRMENLVVKTRLLHFDPRHVFPGGTLLVEVEVLCGHGHTVDNCRLALRRYDTWQEELGKMSGRHHDMIQLYAAEMEPVNDSPYQAKARFEIPKDAPPSGPHTGWELRWSLDIEGGGTYQSVLAVPVLPWRTAPGEQPAEQATVGAG